MPQKGASLVYNFDAKEVFLVMRPINGNSKVKVFLDGKPVDSTNGGSDVVNGEVTVDTDRLYNLIKLNDGQRHMLELDFEDSNLELYAFTFG